MKQSPSKQMLTRRAFLYRCETCGYQELMWLELGLEEHGDERAKPVPYVIGCPKCGEHLRGMVHVRWEMDVLLDEPVELSESHCRFEYHDDHSCGVPVFPEFPDWHVNDFLDFDEEERERKREMRQMQRDQFKKRHRGFVFVRL